MASKTEEKAEEAQVDEAKSETGSEEDESQLSAQEFLTSKGYILGESLGKGQYSKILECTKEGDSTPLAVKIIDKNDCDTNFWEIFLPRDIAAMEILICDNIISVCDEFETSDNIYTVMKLPNKNEDLLIYLGIWPTVFNSLQGK